MKIHSIEQHKEHLHNFDIFIKKLSEEIERKVRELQRYEQQGNFLRYQIKKAIEKGKKEFDAEKFLKKERPRS